MKNTAAVLLVLFGAACTGTIGGDWTGGGGDPSVNQGYGGDGSTSTSTQTGSVSWTGTGSTPTEGTLSITLAASESADDEIVSLGVPMPPGTLSDVSQFRVYDDNGNEIESYSTTLATWPGGNYIRSALVAFRASATAGETQYYSLDYGVSRTKNAETLAANPDGPIVAILDPSWYATSLVIGFQVSNKEDSTFTQWENDITEYLVEMDPPWEEYGQNCDSTSEERTYYDSPHALFQRFIHYGTESTYRRAREESVWYRNNELDWYENGTIAVYSCLEDWDPEEPMGWGVLRRMLGQGMLDDYLLTGDPEALATLRGLGEAFRQNTPALTSGDEITVKVTERNMAWPMMGLASYYAVDHNDDILSALNTLVDMTIEWQAEGESGAFEHDINRPDPSECGYGPNGASPFMTSLLIDGLMDSYFMTGRTDIADVVIRSAEWFRDDAITSDGMAFQYLWNCEDVDYDDSSTADLNVLISHVFGAAYFLSNDTAWLDFGDQMATYGSEAMYAGKPKQWSQSSRTFIKYMGYRALGKSP